MKKQQNVKMNYKKMVWWLVKMVQKTLNLLISKNTTDMFAELMVKKVTIKHFQTKLTLLLFKALADDQCHDTYHNLDECVQFFPQGGNSKPYDNEKFCGIRGGTTLRDNGGSTKTGLKNFIIKLCI